MALPQYSPTQPAVAVDSEPTVVEVMHRGVIACHVDSPPQSLAALMRQHSIQYVVVLDGQEPVGVIGDGDLLRHASTLGTETAGSLAHRPVARLRASTGVGRAIDILHSGKAELLLIENDEQEPIGTLTVAEIASYMAGTVAAPIDLRASAPITDVMSHGVLLVDPGASARDVALAMRASGFRLAVVLDLEGETIGVIDQRALLRAWGQADTTTAAQIMQTETVTVPPDATVAEAAACMADAGLSQALVEPPLPAEWSGRWSTWKERGLPRGLVSAEGILNAVHDLPVSFNPETTAPPTATVTPPSRRNAFAALVTAMVVIAVLVIGIAFSLGGYRIVSCPQTQIAHARC